MKKHFASNTPLLNENLSVKIAPCEPQKTSAQLHRNLVSRVVIMQRMPERMRPMVPGLEQLPEYSRRKGRAEAH